MTHLKTQFMKINYGIIKSYIFLFSILVLLSGCQPKKATQNQTPYLIMLSMDGFRWDYTDMHDTPNFDRIAEKGVKAASMQACFPTKTFPNHYSIVTGLYPDHHGLVNNNFYAPDLDLTYKISDRHMVENASFYGGEPIWVAAEKQNLTTASFFWVGSEAPIGGIYPTYLKTYEHEFPFEQRLDTVIAWLQLPEEMRPHLITWYVDEPDSHGHELGPLNPELGKTIVSLDSLLGLFLQKIETLPIADELNIIITSDHGMGSTSSERRINLSKYVDPEWFLHIAGGNPIFNLTAKPEFYNIAWESLNIIPNMQSWKKGEVHLRYNYGNNPRVGDFILLADSSWSISFRESNSSYTGGTHGYDNQNTDMHAIFYAYGPAFRKNYVHPGFDNIDIYPLICEILDIEPAPVDGKLEHVIELLESKSE